MGEMRGVVQQEALAPGVESCSTRQSSLILSQLTIQLDSLVKEPSMQSKLISIYTDFIADFEAKMDPLRLAQIGMAVVEKYSTPDDAIAFVEKIQDKVKMNNEALCLCKVGGTMFFC